MGPDHPTSFRFRAENSVGTDSTLPVCPISFSDFFVATFFWGVGRRIVAMRRAGDIVTAISPIAGGIRAGVGMTALVGTYGWSGSLLRSCGIITWENDYLVRPNVLDASSGRRGTTAMSGMRLAADLGEYDAGVDRRNARELRARKQPCEPKTALALIH